MARLLAEAGQRVLIIDKRDHIGGNAYDYVNEYGVLVQKYGVHAFHTNSDVVFDFLSRFTEWTPYEHRVKASVNGHLLPFPINRDTMCMIEYAWGETGQFPNPRNAEEQAINTVGATLYEIFFRDYTEKHWGRAATELDPSVTARIPFRPDDTDDRVFRDKYQAVPKDGYTKMFERMLDHPGIEVRLRDDRGKFLYRWQNGPHAKERYPRMAWTGPIDEYFSHQFGPLPYRSLTFHHQTYPGGLRQPCAQINYPASWQPFTRTIEWRHITGQECDYTTITTEFPSGEGEPYYPIPAPANRELYERYRDLADQQENVIFIGRLATYQYMDMHQVVGQAMAAFRRLEL